MSVNERMSGFLFLFLKRVRINLAQEGSQARKKYGHNCSKFARDMNNRINQSSITLFSESSVICLV